MEVYCSIEIQLTVFFIVLNTLNFPFLCLASFLWFYWSGAISCYANVNELNMGERRYFILPFALRLFI